MPEQSHKPPKKNLNYIDGNFYFNTSVNPSTQTNYVSANHYLDTKGLPSDLTNYAGNPYLDTNEEPSN